MARWFSDSEYKVNCRVRVGVNHSDTQKTWFLGDEQKDEDAISGKLSVLTERSEENLTEYQRTIQSLRQQHALLREIEEEKKKLGRKNNDDRYI